ncbi:hypothetical protein TIFTF001_019575 [Ficus carica]|uniref:Uncharacterized protein n=1 Tax=Ficus carica TaxID=3494 RepID=A0AA88DJF6_FICCA|nr:hypothetical protein TIFTF001_019575 [Ficus carica]
MKKRHLKMNKSSEKIQELPTCGGNDRTAGTGRGSDLAVAKVAWIWREDPWEFRGGDESESMKEREKEASIIWCEGSFLLGWFNLRNFCELFRGKRRAVLFACEFSL